MIKFEQQEIGPDALRGMLKLFPAFDELKQGHNYVLIGDMGEIGRYPTIAEAKELRQIREALSYMGARVVEEETRNLSELELGIPQKPEMPVVFQRRRFEIPSRMGIRASMITRESYNEKGIPVRASLLLRRDVLALQLPPLPDSSMSPTTLFLRSSYQ